MSEEAEEKEMSDEEKRKRGKERFRSFFSEAFDKFEEEEHIWTDEERDKNLATLEEGLWDFFYSALDEYYKKRSKASLEKSSSDTPTRLADDLRNLWLAEVKLMGWGVARPEFHWLQFPHYQALVQKRGDEKRKLFQHGERYKRFWFGEKNFEVLIDAFDKYVEEEAYERIDDVLYRIFGPEKKASESEIKKMSDNIREGNKRFIEDLKENRAELKESLLGKYYWLKVGLKFATTYVLPWVIVALAVLQVWLALKK